MKSRASAPVRYMLDLARTVTWLRDESPSVLVVQNPPIVLAVVGLLWCRRADRTLVLDSHPAAFGAKGRRIWGLFAPVHRLAARRSAAVLVTDQTLADQVVRWGARPLMVHEAPPDDLVETSERDPGRFLACGKPPLVLFVGVFASDEPVEEVLGAARLLPDVNFAVTGDTSRAAAGLVASAPENVEFVGYLPKARYWAAVSDADVVLTLTTEPTSVIRAAYEATYALRPLVTSDTIVLRDLFPWAIHVAPDAQALAQGLSAALFERPAASADLRSARNSQNERWRKQLGELRAVVAR